MSPTFMQLVMCSLVNVLNFFFIFAKLLRKILFGFEGGSLEKALEKKEITKQGHVALNF